MNKHIYTCGCEQEYGGRWLWRNPECKLKLEGHVLPTSLEGLDQRITKLEELFKLRRN